VAFCGMALSESVNQRCQNGDIVGSGPSHNEIAHRVHAIARRKQSWVRIISPGRKVVVGEKWPIPVDIRLPECDMPRTTDDSAGYARTIRANQRDGQRL